MSIHLVMDTHALYWFLHSDQRLGPKVKALATAPDTIVSVPVIVLAELIFLHRKTIPHLGIQEQIQRVKALASGGLLGFDAGLLEDLPAQLEMHDGMIVAATLRLEQTSGKETFLATRDQQIVASGLVRTIW